jgi:hypothetical protein
MQPSQQLPLRQTPAPLLHDPPSALVVEQLPLLQTGSWHWPALQESQVSPLSPQLLVESPAAQLDPVQQPLQQLPARQVPEPPSQEPLVLSDRPQFPLLLQTGSLHWSELVQVSQDSPLSPQLLVELPEEQVEPVQQPVQQSPSRHTPPLQEVPSLL